MSNKQNGMLRTHMCGEISESLIGQEVTVCGWVNKHRDLGGLHFVDLRDKDGLLQLGFDHFEDKDLLKDLSHETVLQATGVVGERPASAVNTEMKTGRVEVQVKTLNILSTSDKNDLPFLPTGKITATENLRLKYRYLDLRTPRLQEILKLRSEAAMRARNYLASNSFIEVETPMLYKSTPEGARDYIVPSRVNPGKVYALPQSPQTLKQLLMIGGTDRYFQITKCFRDEDLRIDRQPEFTQIDIEASFCEQDYIMTMSEELMGAIFQIDGLKFERMTYAESMNRYGTDKPDTRFDLEHRDVTELFKESSFSVFSSIAKENGLIKALFLPASVGSMSRKDLDGLTEVVKPYGGKGVAFFKVDNEQVSGGISKFITPEILASLQEYNEEKNGTWLFSADLSSSKTHACLDAVRRHLGKKFELAGDDYKFIWIDEFPLFEYDEEEKRLYAKHHPFSMPSKKDLDVFMSGSIEEVKSLTADCYDVVCNGYELSSGSIRIHDSKIQARMFELLGLSEKETHEKFGFFVEALKYGTPPHGGVAFGLDRIVMLLARTENIRDVVAFPKTTSASDLMADAPSVPDEVQLDELSLKWKG